MQACQLFAQQLLEKCPFNLSTEIDLTYLYSKEKKMLILSVHIAG